MKNDVDDEKRALGRTVRRLRKELREFKRIEKWRPEPVEQLFGPSDDWGAGMTFGNVFPKRRRKKSIER